MILVSQRIQIHKIYITNEKDSFMPCVALAHINQVSRTIGNGSRYEVELENVFKNMKNGLKMIKVAKIVEK